MRVFVLGIDSAEPDLVFREWGEKLPAIKSLRSEGAWGRISSTIPPITCPAWPSAFSGFNPGHFGLYDLRYRRPGTYTDFGIVNSRVIKVPRIWDILSRRGLKSGVVFVPTTYPPSRINGFMVSSFLTPTVESQFTHPPSLKKLVLDAVGGPENYIIDVYDYRRKDPKQLYEELKRKTEHDFKVIRKLLKTQGEWDLFVAVIMTVDRAQHTLWKFFDRDHPRYVDDPELRDGLLDLYVQIDRELEKTLELIPKDTAVIVVSDHGAKRMFYRINVNEALMSEGFLKLKEKPKEPIGLADADKRGLIDWEHTQAFALGAYIGQVFINLEGREPKGAVEKNEYIKVRKEVADFLKNIRGPNGEKLDNRVFVREEAYRGEYIDRMPDITVYFDNLHYGANEALGLGSLYSLETVKGPDDSNHGEYGIFVLRDPEGRVKGEIKGLKMEDLAPTILKLLEIPAPSGIEGKSIF
ncbi:MAG: alkaline phosphatase family protein [Thermoproteales archaeon]|nr:alkaline phosphatase family protein [Thermoproteales archaeon]